MAEVVQDKSGGIMALLVLIVILMIGAILWFGGFFGGRGHSGDSGGNTHKIEVDVGTHK